MGRPAGRRRKRQRMPRGPHGPCRWPQKRATTPSCKALLAQPARHRRQRAGKHQRHGADGHQRHSSALQRPVRPLSTSCGCFWTCRASPSTRCRRTTLHRYPRDCAQGTVGPGRSTVPVQRVPESALGPRRRRREYTPQCRRYRPYHRGAVRLLRAGSPSC